MFLGGLTEMGGCSWASTNQRKMLHPKEIEQSDLMVEEVVKVLKETFLNPFSDDLDKKQLYNIVSGKTVSTEIKDSLITHGFLQDWNPSFSEAIPPFG